jgi:hypothetical protein
MGSARTKRLLRENRELWDNSGTKPNIRMSFQKVLDSGTLALGATVFESSRGERVLRPNTCKGKCCASCGSWATKQWQHGLATILPATEYASIGLSMPPEFWKILDVNRHLLRDIPAIAAGVLQDWATDKADAEIGVLAICHTFGTALEFKPHLHMLVTNFGLCKTDPQLSPRLYFPKIAITERWRHALLNYFLQAYKADKLATDLS